MNWLKNTRKLLGRFWHFAFSGHDFIHGVESIHTLFGNARQAGQDKWAASLIAQAESKHQDNVPYPVYLISRHTTKDSNGAISVVSGITKPAATLESLLNGESAVGSVQSAGGWTLKLFQPVPEPVQLADHVIDFTKTLFNGPDYDWFGDYILFHVDPAKFELDEVQLIDGEGNLCSCYKLFGWAPPSTCVADMVAAFESPELASPGGKAWNIHQKGATHFSAKRLLAEASSSVVSDTDGIVSRVWREQGSICMLVDKTPYYAPLDTQRNYSVGDTVHKGDVLFGTLLMMSGAAIADSGISSDLVPGIRVMTDAGEMVAPNQNKAVLEESGVRILPLQASAPIEAAYKKRCIELHDVSNCPQVELEATVNPFLFIMQKLRRGRSVFASLAVSRVRTISAALACIRRSMNAAGLLTVYVRAEGDTVGVTLSGFTAEAGNGAVAVDATVTIKEMAAAAEVVI